jgi:hypothetical protein
MLGLLILKNKEVCLQVSKRVWHVLVNVDDSPLAPQQIVFLRHILVNSKHVERVMLIPKARLART